MKHMIFILSLLVLLISGCKAADPYPHERHIGDVLCLGGVGTPVVVHYLSYDDSSVWVTNTLNGRSFNYDEALLLECQ